MGGTSKGGGGMPQGQPAMGSRFGGGGGGGKFGGGMPQGQGISPGAQAMGDIARRQQGAAGMAQQMAQQDTSWMPPQEQAAYQQRMQQRAAAGGIGSLMPQGAFAPTGPIQWNPVAAGAAAPTPAGALPPIQQPTANPLPAQQVYTPAPLPSAVTAQRQTAAVQPGRMDDFQRQMQAYNARYDSSFPGTNAQRQMYLKAGRNQTPYSQRFK